MRLFVALDLSEEIKIKITPLLQAVPAGRPATLDQLHLTLFFLGNVPEKNLPKVKEALGGIKQNSFLLKLKGVGCFPNSKRPRILWVGIPLTNELSKLKKETDDALQDLGYQKEKRPFHPHLTLARIKKPHPKGIEDFLNKNLSFQTPDFPVNEFYLYQSTLTPKGARYQRVAQFPLI